MQLLPWLPHSPESSLILTSENCSHIAPDPGPLHILTLNEHCVFIRIRWLNQNVGGQLCGSLRHFARFAPTPGKYWLVVINS